MTPAALEGEGWNSVRVRRILVTVIVSAFGLFQILWWSTANLGKETVWHRELAVIDARFDRGEFERAARELTDFGERWPGAKASLGWNQKMGRYHAKAGDWHAAFQYYERADQIAPGTPGLSALTGEAAWKVGAKDKAIAFLVKELEKTDPSVGDHDRANFYLGLSLLEEGQLPEAFQHFQAISKRAAWDAELKPIYKDLEKNVIQPAREMAATSSVEQLLNPPATEQKATATP